MADWTFADITTVPTQTEAFDGEIVPELQTRGIPTTDWADGDALRTMALTIARLHVKGREAQATLAAAMFDDYVFGRVDPPGGIAIPDSWATLYAKQRYNIDRIAATYTTRTITFTNAAAGAYGPFNKGDLTVEFTNYTGDDTRYVLDEDAFSIAVGTSDAVFRSEYVLDSANGYNYNHGTGATIVMVNASYPGVTVTNPATTYTSTSLSGTSEGTVTPTGVPAGLFTTSSWAVEITVTGQAAACTWRYRALKSDNTYTAWATVVATAAVANAGGSGITITLANDATVNPSFVAGDVFRFATPGTDIVVAGRDIEARQVLGDRCSGMWALLNHVVDEDGNALPKAPALRAYDTLVRAASTQIVHTLVATNTTVNGRVDITIAGQGAPLAPAIVTAVQNFMDSRSDLTDYVNVQSPDVETITLAGAVTVTVEAAMLTTAQEEMQDAIDAYFTGTDGDNPIGLNPRIDRAYLVSLIRNTRGVTATNADTVLTINGAAVDLQLPVTPNTVELARWTGSVSTLFTWSIAA